MSLRQFSRVKGKRGANHFFWQAVEGRSTNKASKGPTIQVPDMGSICGGLNRQGQHPGSVSCFERHGGRRGPELLAGVRKRPYK